jgi:excisionase family DNA binding protein
MTAAVDSLPLCVDLKAVNSRTGIAVRTLRDWIAQGALPAFRLPGGQIRVRVDDVQALFTPVTLKH